jgi:hypothetical protein
MVQISLESATRVQVVTFRDWDSILPIVSFFLQLQGYVIHELFIAYHGGLDYRVYDETVYHLRLFAAHA